MRAGLLRRRDDPRPAHRLDGQGRAHDAGGRRAARSGSPTPARSTSPSPGWTKLDLVEYYLAVADAVLVHVRERPTVMKRFVNGIMEDPIWQKRVPQKVPDWLADRDRRVPVRPHRRGARRQRRRPPRLGGQPRRDRLQPVAGAPRATSTTPTSCASTSTRHAGIGWDAVRRTAMVVRDVLAEHGLRGYPKTSGSKGIHVNVRIEPRWDFLGGAPRRARDGARGRAPRARPGDDQVVEGGAPRRVRRLQPERPRPHGRLLLLGAPHARRARLLRARVGGGARRRAGRPAARHRARAARHASATRAPTSTSTPGSLEALLDLARRDEEEGLGDAPVAAALPQAEGRAEARPAEPRHATAPSSAAAPATRSRAARRRA